MGKHKNATKGWPDAQKGISPTLLSHVGEAGDTGDVVDYLRDEVASLEDTLLQMGISSKMTYHLVQHSRSPSKWSLSHEHWQSNPAHEDGFHYCVQVRVTLEEEGGDQAPTFPCMDQFIYYWHVPGWPWRTNSRGCGPSPQAGDLIF